MIKFNNDGQDSTFAEMDLQAMGNVFSMALNLLLGVLYVIVFFMTDGGGMSLATMNVSYLLKKLPEVAVFLFITLLI